MPASPRHAATPPRDWKTPVECAAIAGVSVKTIRRRILDGSLPAHRFGPQVLRIDRADLDKLFRPVQ
jgi:excisionase family DNA binding protein